MVLKFVFLSRLRTVSNLSPTVWTKRTVSSLACSLANWRRRCVELVLDDAVRPKHQGSAAQWEVGQGSAAEEQYGHRARAKGCGLASGPEILHCQLCQNEDVVGVACTLL